MLDMDTEKTAIDSLLGANTKSDEEILQITKKLGLSMSPLFFREVSKCLAAESLTPSYELLYFFDAIFSVSTNDPKNITVSELSSGDREIMKTFIDVCEKSSYFFIVLTIAFVGLFVILYSRIPNKKRFLPMDIILLLFISGAIGNFIDRVRLQYVIDFFYFKLIDFPIFNVADIYVTVAAFCLIVLFLFYYKEADLEEVFPSKKKKDQEA